ncbi:unnamed protein product, partial [Mesorhabditis spiculigera]
MWPFLGKAPLLLGFFIAASTDASSIKDLFSGSNLKMNGDSYNPEIRPGFGSSNNPAVVTVNFFLRDVEYLDAEKNEIGFQITLRQEWSDPQLGYTAAVAGETLPKNFRMNWDGKEKTIWMPDTFIQNERTAARHEIPNPNSLIIINTNGSVMLSERLSLKTACIFDMENYPLDVHVCYVDFASYGWTTEDVDYKWKEANPIQLRAGVSGMMPEFRLNTGAFAMSSIPREAATAYEWLIVCYLYTGFALIGIILSKVLREKDGLPMAPEPEHQVLIEGGENGGPPKVCRITNLRQGACCKAWLPGTVYFTFFTIFCTMHWFRKAF